MGGGGRGGEGGGKDGRWEGWEVRVEWRVYIVKGNERDVILSSSCCCIIHSTPWGGMWRSNSGRNSAASIRIASRAGTPAPTAGEQLASIPEGQDLKEQPIGEKRPSVAMEMKWPSVSSISSVSSSELPPSLVDKVGNL